MNVEPEKSEERICGRDAMKYDEYDRRMTVREEGGKSLEKEVISRTSQMDRQI